jgi:hypothetical protein
MRAIALIVVMPFSLGALSGSAATDAVIESQASARADSRVRYVGGLNQQRQYPSPPLGPLGQDCVGRCRRRGLANDTAQQRRGPSELHVMKNQYAPAVCCSAWFGVRTVRRAAGCFTARSSRWERTRALASRNRFPRRRRSGIRGRRPGRREPRNRRTPVACPRSDCCCPR